MSTEGQSGPDDFERELQHSPPHMLFLDVINAATNLAAGKEDAPSSSGRSPRQRLEMLRDRLAWERDLKTRVEDAPAGSTDADIEDFGATVMVLALHHDIRGEDPSKTGDEIIDEFTGLIDRSLQRDAEAAAELDTLIFWAGLRYFPDGA